MSSKHLGQGSTCPPKKEGVWRLYSMAYCPFAQRARLVLALKNVPHEIVNIDLKNKPDWYLKLSTTGKVPLLDTGSEIVTESLDICYFINEKFPDPSLFSSDQKSIDEDKKLIDSFGPLIGLYYEALFKVTDKSLQQHLEDMNPHLQALNAALKSRGKFFGGSEPKMPDFMLWPWAERSPVLGLVYGEKLPLEDLQLSEVRNWYKGMKEQKVIQDLLVDLQVHHKLTLCVRNDQPINYDELE